MLDNIRVLQQISSKVNDFIQYQSDLDTAVQRVGKQILDLQDLFNNDPDSPAYSWEPFPSKGIYYSINQVFKDLQQIKLWSGKTLSNTISIGVDGSQINFDHHVSPQVAMVQTGYLVSLGGDPNSTKKTSKAYSESIPRIYGPRDLAELNDASFGIGDETAINYWRWMQETKIGICLAEVSRGHSPSCTACEYIEGCKIQDIDLNVDTSIPVVLFIDGSLIPSFLLKLKKLAEKYVRRTRVLLKRCQELNVPVVGAIAHSGGNEISSLILKSQYGSIRDQRLKALIPSDPKIFHSHLKQFGDRSPLFKSNRKILKQFEEQSIGFFYLRSALGVPMRLEMPTSITEKNQSSDMLNTTWKIILAQSGIGRGYPYVLERSHEHAVLKYRDRDQFYHLLRIVLQKYGYDVIRSPKALRKNIPLI